MSNPSWAPFPRLALAFHRKWRITSKTAILCSRPTPVCGHLQFHVGWRIILQLINNGSLVGLATLRRIWSMVKATAPQERAPTTAAATMLLTSGKISMSFLTFLAFLTGFLAFFRTLAFFDGFAFFAAFFDFFAAAFFASPLFLAAAFFRF